MTKTVRSRFNHEVGETVEGCIILEKHVISPPDPVEKRRGIYDYIVDVPPAPMKESSRKPAAKTPRNAPAESGSFTRATPDERGGVVRRLPSR